GVTHYRSLMRFHLRDPLDAANQLLRDIGQPWLSRVGRQMNIQMCCVYLFNAGRTERAVRLLAETGTTETFQPLLDGLSGDWEMGCRFLEDDAKARDPNGSRMERWQSLVALAGRRRLMGQHNAAEAALLSCLDFTDPADLDCQMSVRHNFALLYAGEMER